MPGGVSWVRITGDGLAVQGPCVLHGLIVWPDSDGDYADVYDGLDATAGKKFCRVECAASTTRHVQFGQGVEFTAGVYVDGIDSAVQTTVLFEQAT